jgi:DNA-binding MarR family transcriptional regulator
MMLMAQKPKAELVSEKKDDSPDDELVSLCRKMRLMSERDTDATLPQVLKVMMLRSRGQPVGGSELSELSGINRITIIHHLKRLENAGLVQRQESKYVLRVQSAEEMLLRFREEMERHFQEMDEMAREIDAHFEAAEREFEERQRRRRQP